MLEVTSEAATVTLLSSAFLSIIPPSLPEAAIANANVITAIAAVTPIPKIPFLF
jgi:hypothetical protein